MFLTLTIMIAMTLAITVTIRVSGSSRSKGQTARIGNPVRGSSYSIHQIADATIVFGSCHRP
jgi:hypothetical protein